MSPGTDSATIVISRERGGWRDRARSYVVCEPGGPPSAGLRQVVADTGHYIKLTRI